MTKPLDVQPRRGYLLLARALFFAMSIVLSSSREDPSAPLRSRQARGAAITGLPPDQDVRALHSKSAKTKSSKSGFKSGKGKASKSKAAKAKASKSKASKSKSAKVKAGKAKSKSVSSDRSQSEKGKAEKSEIGRLVSSEDSVESFRSKSLNNLESSSTDTETENIPLPTETETSVITELASAELNSVHQVDVEGNTDAQTGSVSENPGSSHSVTQGVEETGTTSPDTASSPLDVAKSNITDVAPADDEAAAENANLEGDSTEEKVGESRDDTLHAQSVDSNVDNFSSQEGEDTSNSSHEFGTTSSDESMEEQAPNLESEFVEERIELDEEDFQNFDEREAVLDSSRESVE